MKLFTRLQKYAFFRPVNQIIIIIVKIVSINILVNSKKNYFILYRWNDTITLSSYKLSNRTAVFITHFISENPVSGNNASDQAGGIDEWNLTPLFPLMQPEPVVSFLGCTRNRVVSFLGCSRSRVVSFLRCLRSLVVSILPVPASTNNCSVIFTNDASVKVYPGYGNIKKYAII